MTKREEKLEVLLIEVQGFLYNLKLPRKELLVSMDIMEKIKKEIGE